ncbi:MAG: YihY/virulence factor BrkB family protein [Ignavibacteriaceae bacterium]|nr:YihY/virulence factor BrkB family protein [Ignavibacteriaceae bacterium]
MLKFKFINDLTAHIKESKAYEQFRKLRFLLHLTPSFHKLIDFISHYFGGLYKRADEHHIFLLGGGLAFSLFVCIVPFVLIIFSVLGSVLDSTYMQYQINILIETIIPYYQYAEFVKKIIFARITEVIEYKTIAGILGVFGLLFAASGLFSSMRTILNDIFGLKSEEPVLLAKLKDFALVMLVILLFFVTTILMPAFDVLRSAANKIYNIKFLQSGIVEDIIISAVSLFMIFLLFSMLYLIVPKMKIGRKAVFVGAFWAAVLWETAKQLFGYYIYHFAAFGKIYGTYALVVVVAFWIFYASIVFIIGAEIGKLYSERQILLANRVKET